ncbi:amino acid ABC transporter membrane protein 1 (PAAT family) [Breoghania corrubedonensis]|uniref:Amino acid ABC transporter membrane protein 1 (PAAT family) n=1 Tax=Breoghania corrubedonensis TaxID=665038 RepID=A0A2T5V8X4_9HYPH|nr:ABC transporter permease subunit [Breoghania corrubedonensis]PTW60209.1 amino acid ABC transporter membrane protein 1 (PAAT family) [Breoghania corrubedonensis]
MNSLGFFELMSFGPGGWAPALLKAALMTLAIAGTGYVIGATLGTLLAWAKISGRRSLRVVAETYTTVLRGIPDLLVIYLFYFGGSLLLTKLARLFGHDGFVDLPGFAAGSIAIGIVSAAQHTEVFRGAYRAVSTGEIEAAQAIGMDRFLLFRRILLPLVARHALPGMGNVWQITLKESALVSVTGVVELVRQAQIGAGSTREPFYFFFAAAVLFLVITSLSGFVLGRAERYFNRGVRR